MFKLVRHELTQQQRTAHQKTLERVAEIAWHEAASIDRAIRAVIGAKADTPDEDAVELATTAANAGVHLATHHNRATGRPQYQIRDGSGLVLWDGWWDHEEDAMVWREEWSGGTRPAPGVGSET